MTSVNHLTSQHSYRLYAIQFARKWPSESKVSPFMGQPLQKGPLSSMCALFAMTPSNYAFFCVVVMDMPWEKINAGAFIDLMIMCVDGWSHKLKSEYK